MLYVILTWPAGPTLLPVQAVESLARWRTLGLASSGEGSIEESPEPALPSRL